MWATRHRPLIVGLLLTMAIAAGALVHLFGPSATQAQADHAAAHQAVLAQARGRQIPAAQPGQAVHVVVREYERQVPTSVGGPAHLDAALLSPEIRVMEIWAVADEQGRIARVVTYARDTAGALLGQSLVDETARMTVYEARRGTTKMVTFPQRAAISAVGEREDSLTRASDARHARAIREEQFNGRTVLVLEHRSPASGPLPPNAGDLRVKDYGRRLVLARDSSMLLRDMEFVVTESGEEWVLASKEWQRVELLDATRLPAGTLTPQMPATTDSLTPVPLRELSVGEAAKVLPFAFYTLGRPAADAPTPVVRYSVGQQVALSTLPLRFRGLDFAVQRGEAARIVYDHSARYLDVVQGPSASFAASLSQAPAFWASAQPITVQVEGVMVSGWSLSSAPTRAIADPKSGRYEQVPGPQRILLPDVRGTGILLTAQGYGEAELLAAAAQLQRVR